MRRLTTIMAGVLLGAAISAVTFYYFGPVAGIRRERQAAERQLAETARMAEEQQRAFMEAYRNRR